MKGSERRAVVNKVICSPDHMQMLYIVHEVCVGVTTQCIPKLYTVFPIHMKAEMFFQVRKVSKMSEKFPVHIRSCLMTVLSI